MTTTESLAIYDNLPATPNQLDQVVKSWLSYVDRKTRLQPELARGITPRHIADNHMPDHTTRTVKFSVVDTIAPELGPISQIVGATQPHVYVEGVRTSLSRVSFFDFYNARSSETFSGSQVDKLPETIADDGVIPHSFLMYIYAANDLDPAGRIRDVSVAELIIFLGDNFQVHGYGLELGYRELNLNPLHDFHPLHQTLDRFLHVYRPKPIKIKPISISQSLILAESLQQATSGL